MTFFALFAFFAVQKGWVGEVFSLLMSVGIR